MSKSRNVFLPEILVQLRSCIERVAERRIKTPIDFDWLSRSIADRTKAVVSATTLKRFWGYTKDVSSSYQPSRYTLCAMARYVGYNDIEDFVDAVEHNEMVVVQSAEYIGETINADTITTGTRIDLTWSPRRHCRLIALGQSSFKVDLAENTRLRVGDIVTFVSMTQNAPLYFNSVRHPGADTGVVYIAGSRTGVNFVITPRPDNDNITI